MHCLEICPPLLADKFQGSEGRLRCASKLGYCAEKISVITEEPSAARPSEITFAAPLYKGAFFAEG